MHKYGRILQFRLDDRWSRWPIKTVVWLYKTFYHMLSNEKQGYFFDWQLLWQNSITCYPMKNKVTSLIDSSCDRILPSPSKLCVDVVTYFGPSGKTLNTVSLKYNKYTRAHTHQAKAASLKVHLHQRLLELWRLRLFLWSKQESPLQNWLQNPFWKFPIFQ